MGKLTPLHSRMKRTLSPASQFPLRMLPARLATNRPFELPVTLAMIFLIAALCTPLTSAQSAGNSQANSPTAAKPNKPEAPAKPQPNATGPVSIEASRFIDAEELPGFIASMTTAFSMQVRATDPFGQYQDPNAKPVVKTPIAKSSQRAPQLQATPFTDIVRKIVVHTIMPKEKRFLTGTRSVAQGEQISLNFRGKHIRVQVTEVSSQQISFRNLESGELAVRKMDILPPGMKAGLRGIAAPGMTADRRNAPIDLEGEPSDQSSTNR
jgi:hypothetical protein